MNTFICLCLVALLLLYSSWACLFGLRIVVNSYQQMRQCECKRTNFEAYVTAQAKLLKQFSEQKAKSLEMTTPMERNEQVVLWSPADDAAILDAEALLASDDYTAFRKLSAVVAEGCMIIG